MSLRIPLIFFLSKISSINFSISVALFWGLYVCCRSIIHKNIETANGVLGKFRDINALIRVFIFLGVSYCGLLGNHFCIKVLICFALNCFNSKRSNCNKLCCSGVIEKLFSYNCKLVAIKRVLGNFFKNYLSFEFD